MDIKLLTVTGGTLEGNRKRAAVDKDGTLDGTFGLALGQNIEKCGLSGTRRAH